MDFAFNDDQELFRKAVHGFAAKEIAPIASECDERGEYPLSLFRKIGELGYLGAKFPPEYGGSQAGLVSGAIMAEELAQASPGIFLGIYVHVYLALSAVAAFGSEAQKEAYLRPGIAGEKIGAWGFAEPDAGSDPGGMKTKAIRDGDSYRINGSKILITNVDIADFLVVTTVTTPDVYPVHLSAVGNYALSIEWSDGHRTGIYSWDMLRAICPELLPVAPQASS